MAETQQSSESQQPSASEGGSTQRGLPHLDDLYREVVLDHYRHPRGHKELESPDIDAGGFNPTCGDQVRVAVEIEQDRIRDLQVECQGCSISVASGSMMADLLVGKNQQEVERLTQSFTAMMHGQTPDPELDLGDLVALEGVRKFPVRIKCALLAWTTLSEAMRSFLAKREKSDGHQETQTEQGGTAG